MYAPGGAGLAEAVSAVLSGIRNLRRQCGNLTVVTNEIFSGGAEYGEETVLYMKALAEINQTLASEADFVCEIVCGRENVLKGGPPFFVDAENAAFSCAAGDRRCAG